MSLATLKQGMYSNAEKQDSLNIVICQGKTGRVPPMIHWSAPHLMKVRPNETISHLHAEAETGVYAVVLLSSVNLHAPFHRLDDAGASGGPQQSARVEDG